MSEVEDERVTNRRSNNAATKTVPAVTPSHHITLRLARRNRFEFVDAAVCHQRKKKMVVPYHVGPDEAPLLDDLIVHGTGGTRGTRQDKRTDMKLIGAAGLPAPPSPIAIDARVQLAIGSELNR